MRRVPIDGALFDVSRLTVADYEGFGTLAEERTVVGLGLVPAIPGARRARPDALAAPAVRLYHEIGLPQRDLARVTVTPTCGSPGPPRMGAGRVRRLRRFGATALAEAAQA